MKHEPLDAVVVGAGFSGIGAAIELKSLGYRNIVVVEREDDLGGTWHVNRYPGAAVDIMSTAYQYHFEPNPRWSRLYANGPELKQYADHVADKYDIRRHVRLNTSVQGAVWDEDDQVWRVSLSDDETLITRFLINASGFLSQRHYPDIPGLDSFEGEIVHTTWWDKANDFTGRRIGVIGTGATAVQLLPELAKVVDHMTVYQRTPIWVTPKMDAALPDSVQRLFARMPATHRFLSLLTTLLYDFCLNTGILNYRRYRTLTRFVEIQCRGMMLLTVRDRATRRKLTPDYSLGCKRPAVSNVYYKTFGRSNVALETSGIERIEPDGIVSRDGKKTPIDTLVLATGFNVWDHNFPAFETIGRDGVDLGKWWIDQRYASYQGITVPNFPNYIAMTSPWAFTGLSFFNTITVQMAHIGRVLGEVRKRGASTFEVTDEACQGFANRMRARMGDTVLYSGRCDTANSYYFNNDGEAAWFRPTSRQNAIREQKTFPISDYKIA
ncbi:NAD(P)/FAD-dependent oxidoreductase [Mycobacterium sp. 94-17]|uniref:flavin-containing monooxygenase n=1 Tax=Mycobacterium sp. 94-17 TaxID=2986147 RepID=UPI002D1F3C43|nr:NAD(P)/FAD-dependent oxidoreductase [Mycobacterium sp. 94-17]MEB4209554.1 NAD(P)/FAD-dependent oxidoreductase [Mycobacterium sp. 94-17]